MILWLDAPLPPSLAGWVSLHFQIKAIAVRDIGLRDAKDREIFQAARDVQAVVMTKDRDFVDMLNRFGAPPKVIWLTCGNTSNVRLQRILNDSLKTAMDRLNDGENLVEIGSDE